MMFLRSYANLPESKPISQGNPMQMFIGRMMTRTGGWNGHISTQTHLKDHLELDDCGEKIAVTVAVSNHF